MATASGIPLINSQELNNPVGGTGDINFSSGTFYAPSGSSLPTLESSGQLFLRFDTDEVAISTTNNWLYLALA